VDAVRVRESGKCKITLLQASVRDGVGKMGFRAVLEGGGRLRFKVPMCPLEVQRLTPLVSC
jgi:hypothetical protein